MALRRANSGRHQLLAHTSAQALQIPQESLKLPVLTKRIAEETHGGKLALLPSDKGATFQITFPA